MAEGGRGNTYLCPRCLAPVTIPEAIQATSTGREADFLTVLPADEPEFFRRSSPERDLRRSNRGMFICLGLLAVFGIVGLVGFVTAAADIHQPFAMGVIGVGLLGVVGSAIYLTTLRDSPVARGLGFGLLAVLAMIGVLVLALAALVMLLFVICLSAVGGKL
jgi:hypothetical protein